MRFEFKGKLRINNKWKPFTRVIDAGTESFARKKLLSLFGSEHKIKRRFITIDSVREVKE